MPKWLVVFLAGFLTMGVAACDNDGPMEETGEEMDDAMEEAGDSVEDAADDMEDALD